MEQTQDAGQLQTQTAEAPSVRQYTVSPQDEKFLTEVFVYHKPFGDQSDRYERLRPAGRALAEVIIKNCPPSPERTLALRDLQRAIMMANAAIAINEQEFAPKGETAGQQG